MSNVCMIAASLVAHGQVPGWELAVPPTPQLTRRLPLSATLTISRMCEGAETTLAQMSGGERTRPEFSRGLNRGLSRSVNSGQARNLYQFQLTANRRSNLKPVTGAQLYQQRLAATRWGHLYTRLNPSSYLESWQDAQEQPTYQQWVELLSKEAQMVERGQGKNRLTAMIGDSHAMWFPYDRLEKDRLWLNQGISGDTTEGVLKRLPTLNEVRPDVVHVMVGINDLRRGKSDSEILSNLRTIMRYLRLVHPTAQVYVHSILPTRLAAIPNNRVRWLNYNIASLTKEENVSFLNLQPAFADQDGNLQRPLTTDGVHLSAKGYQVWRSAVAPIL